MQAIGINNERMNSKLKRITKTALSLGPKSNYNVAAHIESGIDLPKVVNEKHQTSRGEGGSRGEVCHSGI